jgi:hypothetical protein
MDFRKFARLAVNILALVAAVLALPQLGAIMPADALPLLASVAAMVNMALSAVRWVAEGKGL